MEDISQLRNLSDVKKPKNYHLRFIWDWLIQISLWVAIGAVIIIIITVKEIEKNTNIDISKKTNETINYILVILMGVLYITYCINNTIFSNTFKLLFSNKKSLLLEYSLSKIFKSKPEIKFYIECFHKETRKSTDHSDTEDISRVSNITLNNNGESKNINTYEECFEFSYRSCRDVSGSLDISEENEKGRKKYFIDLSLNFEIFFSDQLSAYLYDKAKRSFIKENRWRDARIHFREVKIIEGLFGQKLLKIKEEQPIMFKWYIFLVFTVFSLSEIYKLILKMYTHEAKFTIKKLISVTEVLEDTKYKEDIPKLIYDSDKSREFTFLLENINYKPPKIKEEDMKKCQMMEFDNIDYHRKCSMQAYEGDNNSGVFNDKSETFLIKEKNNYSASVSVDGEKENFGK